MGRIITLKRIALEIVIIGIYIISSVEKYYSKTV
jgi:hypothetical protein